MGLKEEFLEEDKKIPFTKRVETFLELFNRYCEIRGKFIYKGERIGKKEKYDLLTELEVVKNAINSQLPDYKKK